MLVFVPIGGMRAAERQRSSGREGRGAENRRRSWAWIRRVGRLPSLGETLKKLSYRIRNRSRINKEGESKHPISLGEIELRGQPKNSKLTGQKERKDTSQAYQTAARDRGYIPSRRFRRNRAPREDIERDRQKKEKEELIRVFGYRKLRGVSRRVEADLRGGSVLDTVRRGGESAKWTS